MSIDISRIIAETSEHLGSKVGLEITTEDKGVTKFRFAFTLKGGNYKLNYSLADFEVKMMSTDVNDVIIGFFKVKTRNLPAPPR